jgi:tetratricopeptide (TPR) repeat protein
VVRVGEASEPAVREQVAKTLFNKGVALGRLGRFEEAVAVYDEVVARFGEASEPAVREQVANALINKGAALGRLGRFEEKLAVYDDVVARFGQAREPAVREQVASALFNKGLALTQAERLAEEVAVYDELVARFGQAREPAVREQVAQALFYKGVRLAELGRVQEAVAVYDEVVARFGEATEPALRDVVRKARASGNEAEAERARLPLPADTAATMLRLPFAVEDLAYEAGRVWLVPSERPGLFYIRATSEAADLRFLPLAAKVKFVAAGWGAIWATCEDHVVRRIDPATVEVAGEAKGPELDYFGMAAGAGAVWISCSKDSIARIDPAALEHRLIDTGPGWRDYRFALELQGLDAGPKDVWVAAIHNDSIVRVDATKLSFKVLRVTEPAGTGRGMEVSPSVPLTDASPLERLDEALHDRSAWRTELPIGPVDVAATADAVWVSGIWNDLLYKPARTPGVVVQLDQAGRLLSESTVGRRPLSLVASPNSVWVANYDDGTVMRIDRGSPEPRPSWIDVGPGPKALAIGGGAIWVATEVGVGRIAEADVG